MKYGFGVDLGGTTVKIAFFEESGKMVSKWEIPTVTTNGGSQILPDIAASIREYLEQNNVAQTDLLGIGIGVPGPVNSKGIVNRCVNLGWGVFDINEELSRLTGLPVKAGNDANVAALGEFWKGGGKDFNNMVFVTLGTGVGGGIVIEGQLLHGAHGSGAEIGHMVLNRDETAVCGCGKRGCVEQYCSASGIVRMAKLELENSEEDSTLRAQNPEVVVLGGGVSKAGSVLLDGLRPYFHKYVFHAASNVEFALAVLGNDAGAYGAFKLALDAFGK